MKALLVLTLALASSSALADLRVEDPQAILSKLDGFLNETLFATAFRQGDVATQEGRSCAPSCDPNDPAKCKVTCGDPYDVRSTVLSVSNDVAVFHVDMGDPSAGDLTMTRQDFDAFHGNFLRMYLSQEGQNYDASSSMSVDWAKPQKSVLRNGQSVDSMKVHFTLHSADGEGRATFAFPMTITLGKGVPFVAQAVEINLYPELTETPSRRLVAFERR